MRIYEADGIFYFKVTSQTTAKFFSSSMKILRATFITNGYYRFSRELCLTSMVLFRAVDQL